MTAQQARKITDTANSQSGELARIYKKIEKAATKGLTWLDIPIMLPENEKILKEQGYDVVRTIDGPQIEW